MTEEKPYPEMTDQDVLERLLPIALDLLETDRKHGQSLWEIYKYLERRLDKKAPENEDTETSAKEIKASKIEFHNANVTVYLNAGTNRT